MTGQLLANAILDGEDPKKFLRQQSDARTQQLERAADFISGYIGCALWSTNDDGGDPLDLTYDVDDIDPKTFEEMRNDCLSFFEAHYDDIQEDIMQAGHDFWLTRNGHGAGFWDGDWPKEVGWELTQASKAFGTYDLYVGDDGKIHGA